MSSIQFEIEQALLNSLLEAPGGIVDRFIEALTRRVEIRAKVTVPRRSFELANVHRTERGTGRNWEVVVPIRYALAVHNGVMARVIVPRRAKVLRWRDEETGEVVFAARAKQDARPGQPWLRRALIVEVSAL